MNLIGNASKLSFGQTVRSRIYNTTKKTQAFGESNGDLTQHTAERYRVNDNDISDGETIYNRR